MALEPVELKEDALSLYQLLAIDLDGTLFGHDLQVSARTRSALAAWQDSGRELVIATGRMFRSAQRVAADLGVTAPIICYQGALIRCPRTEFDLWHHALGATEAAPLVAQLEAQGFTALAFRNESVHARLDNADTRSYTRLSNTEAVWIDNWDSFFAQGATTKVVAVSSPDRVSAVVGGLREAQRGVAHVVQSQPNFLEVVHPQANKGVALARLCQTLGVSLAEAVAVGDGHNDLEMLQTAGLGVAMGNGHPELIAVADRVTRSLSDDGLAVLVEELLSTEASASAD